MMWKRIYSESNETDTIPIEVSMREVKLIQNYLNKKKPLNDPSNRDCMKVVIRILNDLVENSSAEKLDTYISNFFFENFGIEVDIDPYGEHSAIELGENGLIPLSDCGLPELCIGGEHQGKIQGGFWNDDDGTLEEGFISVDDMNLVLQDMTFEQDIETVQLKKDGKVAKIMLTFK